MQNNFITKLVDLKGVKVLKFRNSEHRIRVNIKLLIKKHKCPCCYLITSRAYAYRFQLIKDIPMYYDKFTFIYYRKRRYVCTNCGKKFYEKNTFLPKRFRKTNRLTAFFIDKLNNWVKYNLDSNYEELNNCAKIYFNWIEEIRNSLLVPYSNGVMEGYNNKIKVLKRVAFGFRNFQNFKARILLLN